MQVNIVQIGNSKGIRIPASFLKQCGIDKKVELEIKQNQIVIKPVVLPRQGWAAAFKRMRQVGDDEMIIPADLDAHMLEEWDEN